MRIAPLVFFATFAATAALAADDPATPAAASAERMKELHRIVNDAGTSPEDRRTAREELLRLLRSSDAKVAPRPMPPRAAIIPAPSAVIGTQRDEPAVTVAPTLAPPTPVVGPTSNPSTGGLLVPSGRTAIDSRTGRVVNEVPGGYFDPATGRFISKP
jgi:hypothetical protein